MLVRGVLCSVQDTARTPPTPHPKPLLSRDKNPGKIIPTTLRVGHGAGPPGRTLLAFILPRFLGGTTQGDGIRKHRASGRDSISPRLNSWPGECAAFRRALAQSQVTWRVLYTLCVRECPRSIPVWG